MGMLEGTSFSVQVLEVIHFYEQVLCIWIRTGECHRCAGNRVNVTAILLPDVQQAITVGVLNRGAEDDGAPGYAAAIAAGRNHWSGGNGIVGMDGRVRNPRGVVP